MSVKDKILSNYSFDFELQSKEINSLINESVANGIEKLSDVIDLMPPLWLNSQDVKVDDVIGDYNNGKVTFFVACCNDGEPVALSTIDVIEAIKTLSVIDNNADREIASKALESIGAALEEIKNSINEFDK